VVAPFILHLWIMFWVLVQFSFFVGQVFRPFCVLPVGLGPIIFPKYLPPSHCHPPCYNILLAPSPVFPLFWVEVL
jgi:hypothetical protein